MSIIITGVFRFLAELSGTYYSNVKATQTVTLDVISRKSTVTATSAYVGGTSTITIAKNIDSHTHTLTYSIGSASGTIATKTADTVVYWTVPNTITSQFNSNSAQVRIDCETFNGSTSVGVSSCYVNVSIPQDDLKPTISATFTDTNSTTKALTGNSSVIVKYYSKVSVAANATAQNGATISSMTLTNGNSRYTSNSASISGTFTNLETNQFFVGAIDDRTNATLQAFTPTMIDYIKLTCSIDAPAPNTSGSTTIRVSGNMFNGSFGSVSNTITVKYRYKVNNSTYSSWYNMSVSKSGNTYSASATVSGLSYKNSYAFEAQAVDKLMTVSSAGSAVKTTPVYDWSGDDFNVNVPVTMQDDCSIAGELTIGGKKLVDLVYPIGAIYMSVNSTSPATLFGGTWVSWGAGRVPVGINTSDSNFSTVERTGGASSVSLTTAQMPSHNHAPGTNITGDGQHDLFLTGLSNNAAGFNGLNGIGRSAKVDSVSTAESYYYFRSDNQAALGYCEETGYTGSGSAHNNLQPYIVCYMWKRTA